MNDDIFDEWEKDCRIDRTQLDVESLATPRIHAKYMRMYHSERNKLKILRADLSKLKLAKYEFYIQGPSEETRAKGWRYPKGKILKSDIGLYMDADTDIIDMNLQVGYLEERISALENIIRNLNNRGFQIKNAIDFLRWTNGEI